MSIEVISAFVGLILTLLVFSYLIGDNPLFRLTINLFIGVASGYAAAIILRSVILSKLSALPTQNPTLFAKLSPRTSWMGNFAMAILVGVGAATAIGGALIGTLLPQSQAAMNAFDLGSPIGGSPPVKFFTGIVMLLGTVLTLASFHFSTGRAADGTPKQNPILRWIASAGRVFIAITLGVLFAGVYLAALTAMIERLSAILNIRHFFGL
jgi:hypothetical protein